MDFQALDSQEPDLPEHPLPLQNLPAPEWSEPLLTVPQAQSMGNPWLSSPTLTQPRSISLSAWDHAAPISPLRERDLWELQQWFDRADMPALESDLLNGLRFLAPEPAWEELIF
jgi:hypothetical protein